MSGPQFNLSPAQFAAAFPFHFVLDREMRMLQVGAALRRLCPECAPGTGLADSFQVRRPVLQRVDFDALGSHDASLFVLQRIQGALRLRGEVVVQGPRLFFLGSPWVTEMAGVSRLGLALDDFAVHDPIADLLFLLQTKNKALADAQELSRRLRAQQDRLREAKLAAEVAEEASRAKSQFLAVMSHEIRTPLNGVLGLLEYVLGGELTPRQRTCLGTAFKSGRTLLAIINDILDFSKVEAGKLELQHACFSLRQIVSDAVEMVSFEASQKGLPIHLEVEPQVPQVLCGDPARIRQVLVNYLANAVKFTSAGRITVHVAAVDIAPPDVLLRIEVRDTGIGIDALLQAALFEPFSQVDASTTRKHNGTGLGLAICKKLVQIMGGEVGLHSEPGVGSTFWFSVRVSTGTAAQAPVVPAAPTRVPDRFEGHVLLAEDDPVNQLVARLHLNALGLTVDVVDTGEQAVAAVARRRYDMILMDLRMPDMDGLQACRAIRAAHHNQLPLPIVMWTASMLGVDQRRFTEAGADDALGKPFDLDGLKQMLFKHLGRRAAHSDWNGAAAT
jgi:signal transduction histidine kinase/ActR/RegA family two-component response regulator